MHRPTLHLGLDKARAVAAFVIDVPVSVGGDHRMDHQHRQRSQNLEERRVLRVVSHVVVQDCRHPRGHVDRLVKRGRVVPSLEPPQDQESDDGHQQQQLVSERMAERTLSVKLPLPL